MITLLIDALIALTKTIDRGLTAVENVLRFRPNPPGPSDGEAPPAGAGCTVAASAGSGGHPDRPTSTLLRHAAQELRAVYGDRQPAVVSELISECFDRATYFVECIDD